MDSRCSAGLWTARSTTSPSVLTNRKSLSGIRRPSSRHQELWSDCATTQEPGGATLTCDVTRGGDDITQRADGRKRYVLVLQLQAPSVHFRDRKLDIRGPHATFSPAHGTFSPARQCYPCPRHISPAHGTFSPARQCYPCPRHVSPAHGTFIPARQCYPCPRHVSPTHGTFSPTHTTFSPARHCYPCPRHVSPAHQLLLTNLDKPAKTGEKLKTLFCGHTHHPPKVLPVSHVIGHAPPPSVPATSSHHRVLFVLQASAPTPPRYSGEV